MNTAEERHYLHVSCTTAEVYGKGTARASDPTHFRESLEVFETFLEGLHELKVFDPRPADFQPFRFLCPSRHDHGSQWVISVGLFEDF